MDAQAEKTMLVDLGSAYVKYGAAATPEPQGLLPSIAGVPRARFESEFSEKLLVGLDAIEHRAKLNFFDVLEHAHLSDESMLDELLEFILYSEAERDVERVLVALPLRAERLLVEHIAEFVFEYLGCGALAFALQPVLSVLASGRSSGAVLEVGGGVAQSLCICDGSVLADTGERVDCGGKDVTQLLQLLLSQKGCQLTGIDETQFVRSLKEKSAEVLLPGDEAQRDALAQELDVELPDGVVLRNVAGRLRLGSERFACAELLFSPSEFGAEHAAVHDLLWKSVSKAPMDCKTALIKNVLLTGGCALLTGFEQRFAFEFGERLNATQAAFSRVQTARAPMYSAWSGAQLLTESRLDDLWLAQSVYADSGTEAFVKQVAL